MLLFWCLTPIVGWHLLVNGFKRQARNILLELLLLSQLTRLSIASNLVLAKLGNHLLLSLIQVLEISRQYRIAVLIRTQLLALVCHICQIVMLVVLIAVAAVSRLVGGLEG